MRTKGRDLAIIVKAIDAFGRRHCQRGQHGGRRGGGRVDRTSRRLSSSRMVADVGVKRCQHQVTKSVQEQPLTPGTFSLRCIGRSLALVCANGASALG